MHRQIPLIAASILFASQNSFGQEKVSFQEATHIGTTMVCSVDFESTDETTGDAPVFQLKAAIRTRRIENALFIELAVQADKFEMVDKKLQMTRLVPNSAWMRTSRDNTFATGGRPRVTEQQVYMDVSVEPTNVRILRDLMDGSKVSIGVNYNAEQFDKVFRFKAGLLKEDQVALSKCLDRVFGAIKRKK